MTTTLLSVMLMSTFTISDSLLKAIEYHESKNNPKAVGDRGMSIGSYQIQEAVIIDVNRAYKTKYRLSDRNSREKSREICKLYLALYGKAYQRETGRAPTDEVLARIWNGGPQGWNPKYKAKYDNTTRYWGFIKPLMKGKP